MPSIVAYQASHFDGIRLLWRQAFPESPPKDATEPSFPATLSMQPDLFLVAIERGPSCRLYHFRPWLAEMSQLEDGSRSLPCSPRRPRHRTCRCAARAAPKSGGRGRARKSVRLYAPAAPSGSFRPPPSGGSAWPVRFLSLDARPRRSGCRCRARAMRSASAGLFANGRW